MQGRVIPPKNTRTVEGRVRRVVVAVMVPVILAAVGSLVAEFGFGLPPETLRWVHVVHVVAGVLLLGEPFVLMMAARDKGAALEARWFHFGLGGLLLMAVGAVYASGVAAPGTVALRLVQGAVVLSLLMRLLELNRWLASLDVRPALLFLGSFLTLIAIGTGLLLLPRATVEGRTTGFTDALFTATSAVCVTGLVVADTGTHWAPLGRYVILVLIQLGGLGLMTFGSVFALLMWRGMRVRESVAMREVLSSEVLSEVGRVIVFILLTTLAFELIGGTLLASLWDHTATAETVTPLERFEYSAFHSISAFCNAGFCLYDNSLIDYRDTWQVNLVFPLQIICGGLGFLVLYNLARVLRYRVLGWGRVPLKKKRLSLQSKLTLATTAALLVGGTVGVLALEGLPAARGVARATTWSPPDEPLPELAPPRPGEAEPAPLPMGEGFARHLSGAWFLSVTARTAGFNTTDTRRLAPSTKFLTSLLMLVGASPGSTGGGIKTVTFALILIGVWSSVRGASHTRAFHRTLSREIVLRALAVLAVSAAWVALVTILVAAWGVRDGSRYAFVDVLFETTSAYATVGLSTGVTPLLNTLGRLLITVTMYVGRVGPLTLFVAMPLAPVHERYHYPTEHVAIS